MSFIVFILGLGLVAIIVSGVWWVVWKAWGFVAVAAFGAPELTYWQVAAGMILLGLLTGGLRASMKGGD